MTLKQLICVIVMVGTLVRLYIEFLVMNPLTTKVHFITFASDSIYDQAAATLVESVHNYDTYNQFQSRVYTDVDFSVDFMNEAKKLFMHKRGYGYWIWKPYIILDEMNTMNFGDWLVYSDSMYKATGDLAMLINQQKTVNCFLNKPNDRLHEEEKWTKADLFIEMNMTRGIKGQPIIWAGFLILQKTPEVIDLIREWLAIGFKVHTIDDSPSIMAAESPRFIEHRHDQSILSLLFRREKIKCIEFTYSEFFQGTRL